MQQRQNKTAFMKITKKHDTTKIGCGEFPTKIKNEKQKKSSLFEHHYYSNTYEVST